MSVTIKPAPIDGCGFTSGGQESGSVFSASLCKIHASKHYVESLPLVLKDRRTCFSQGERYAALYGHSHCDSANKPYQVDNILSHGQTGTHGNQLGLAGHTKPS